jgi:hypothetical protein
LTRATDSNARELVAAVGGKNLFPHVGNLLPATNMSGHARGSNDDGRNPTDDGPVP